MTRGSRITASGLRVTSIPSPPSHRPLVVYSRSFLCSEVLFIPNGLITFFLFTSYLHHVSGNAIRVYGDSIGDGNLTLILDGESIFKQLHGTSNVLAKESLVLCSLAGMVHGDHQLYGVIDLPDINAIIGVDYFECVVPSYYILSQE